MLRLFFLTLLISVSIEVTAQSKIRLIGFEAGYERVRFDNILGFNDDFQKGQLEGVVPDNFVFYNTVASPNAFKFNNARAGKIIPQYAFQKSQAKDLSIKVLFQIKNKAGLYSKNHLFNLGLSYQNRTLLGGDFTANDGVNIVDSTGSVFYYNDSVDVVSYTQAYNVSQTNAISNQIKINVGYKYRFFPEEKINITIGGGVDFGYIYEGSFRGKNFAYTTTQYIAEGGILAGEYYSIYDEEKFISRYSGGFSWRTYADVTLSLRLSKTHKLFNNINLFATARAGYDGIKLSKSAYYGNLFVSTSFGISYIFDKYYNT